MYIDPDVRIEDNRSTAWTFTIVSILGIILLILLDLGILPIPVADAQKILLTIVMGAMFFIFLAVGIRSFLTMGKLENEVAAEASLELEIREWFLSEYKDYMKSYHPTYVDEDDVSFETSDESDDDLNTMESPEETTDGSFEDEPGASFYPRYHKMSALIAEKYPSISDEFMDHIVEVLYTAIFSE